MKKAISLSLVLAMILCFLSACGGSGDKPAADGGGAPSADLPAINDINLGEDYQDVTATVKILTNRTDIVDTVYAGYAAKFHELYPNITVEYEAITDYEEALNLRLPNGDWGDICFLPTTVAKSDMSTFFIPLGDMDTLDEIYQFIPDKSFGGKVYGIANGGNADGVAYNKKVFEAAGYTAGNLPATPDEFMQALRDIKAKTDAIPLYTNFAAGWTMGAWDAYIAVAATGDQDFRNYKIVHTANPFSDKGDGTGPYAVYKILYDAVSEGLVEPDPMSSDWDGCKGMINRGEIGCMVLGSWAVQQFKEAGDNPDDIAYMPFPITVTDAEGNRVTSAGGNYSYGINCKTDVNQQIASMVYLKWLLEESPIFTDEGCIPALKSAAMPDFLADFQGIQLLSNNPAPDGEEDYFDKVNLESEVGINNDDYPDCAIVEAALLGSKSIGEIMDEWNQKWTRAQESLGMEILF